MTEILSSYLTPSFFITGTLIVFFVGIAWRLFDSGSIENTRFLAIYAVVMLIGLVQVMDPRSTPEPISFTMLLVMNAVLLALSLRRPRFFGVNLVIATVYYFAAMGVPGFPPIAATAGIVLSLACGALYWRGIKQLDRRGRHRRPVPPPSARGDDDDVASVPVRATRYTLADIVGMSETKTKLLKAGQDAIRPIRGEPPRNGILLFGEPGNGKTFFAEALAGELGLPFLKLTNSDVASRWINQTTEGVKKAFDDARRAAPCMLFIDEVDSFLGNRETTGGSDSEVSRTANSLLTLINDLRGTGVLLVAATNFLDRLDQAGIREGRFDFKIEIPPPDEEARRALLQKALGNTSEPVAEASRWGRILAPAGQPERSQAAPTVADVSGAERAAKRWEGFSVARITAIGKEAVDAARREGRERIDFDDLMRALRALQGTLGDRIPEDTPDLSGVYLTEGPRRKMSSVALRMKEIELVEERGGSLPSGVLFYGPPGTGKTFAARALAKETGWAFIATNGQELLADRDAVKKLIKRAREIRPVIVFIDEADDVLADRSTNAWNKAVTNDLLTAIDGAKGRVPDIVWIAATNLPDALDTAVVRGGRFTEKILFDLPDEATLTTYIARWREKSRSAFDDALTPAALAHAIGQVSIANVQAILQTAVNHMIGYGDAVVRMDHVIAARDEVLGGA